MYGEVDWKIIPTKSYRFYYPLYPFSVFFFTPSTISIFLHSSFATYSPPSPFLPLLRYSLYQCNLPFLHQYQFSPQFPLLFFLPPLLFAVSTSTLIDLSSLFAGIILSFFFCHFSRLSRQKFDFLRDSATSFFSVIFFSLLRQFYSSSFISLFRLRYSYSPLSFSFFFSFRVLHFLCNFLYSSTISFASSCSPFAAVILLLPRPLLPSPLPSSPVSPPAPPLSEV